MKITKIEGFGSFGNIVEDVDLEKISEEDWYEIKMSHAKNLLTIIRLEKKLDYKKYYSLIQNIGIHTEINPISIQKLFKKKSLDEIHKIKKISDNFKVDKNFQQLFRVTALKDEEGLPLGAFDDGELLWHSNNAGLLEFGPGVALMGFQQMTKSATGFLQTADYFESLSESFKKELMEMVVVHNYKKATINPEEIPDQELIYETSFCPEENSRIPLVIKSPSGIVGLHIPLNTFDYIEGMNRDESVKLFEYIKKNLFVEKYIYDYWWENNQNILLFDNSITLHRRLVKGSSCGDRIAYRIPFSYESLYGYYDPYFQEEFSNLRKNKCDYFKSITSSSISSEEIKKIQILSHKYLT